MPPEAILPLGVRLDPRYEQQVLEIDDTKPRLKIFKCLYFLFVKDYIQSSEAD